jgi:Ca2+/Na+ antiporter
MNIFIASVWSQMFTVPTVIFIVGGMIAIVGIVFGSVAGVMSSVVKTREREQSRRELAAYVAEGTLDPDKAIEMLKAAPPSGEEAD